MSLVLYSGLYTITDNCLEFLDKKSADAKNSIKIKSKKKINFIVKGGRFFETQYKRCLIGTNKVFSFIKGKNRYLLIKENYLSNKNKLPYDIPSAIFVDKYKLIILNYVKGEFYSDSHHFNEVLDYLFSSYIDIKATLKNVKLDKTDFSLQFCSQHGDCHMKNIVWHDSTFTFIDVDDINNYPLFYDLFYFIFHSLKFDEINKLLNNKKFIEKFNRIIKYRNLSENSFDVYLTAVINCWLEDYKATGNKKDLYFYYKWIENIDLKSFPLAFSIWSEIRKILNKKYEK